MKPPSRHLKLGLVNDNAVSCEAIRRLVATRDGYQLLWTAYDGAEAVEYCRTNPPDVVLMDVVMPRMDGVEATREIVATTECAVLLVTWSIPRNTSKVFEAMGAGALDVVTTPSMGNLEEIDTFFRKIEQIKTLRAPMAMPPRVQAAAPATEARSAQKLILLGASAGGPAALAEILSGLDATLPTGIVIAQHMDVRFGDDFISWLGDQTAWPVRKAQAGDAVTNGLVLVAGAEHHLVFRPGNRLHFTDQPAFAYIPSVNVLFSSAAEHWKGSLAAALLTGMGSDGAEGLKQLRQAGHLTIAQDEASCALFGMPKAAAAIGAAREILPLNRIVDRLAGFSLSN
ncbi:chemotaxis-specific protein-glutamate methyltransferase CheB [Luteolibacter pohnpeiensis]|uniref:protein-glutamate methylesterase n=1 Tax=Luteolibacter pohnpeiensis TaxID=454153 RepID=A0A934SAI5_9BACT|nr:chemotaxis-specific protein-glutamate methyltransferase CheB [Luteolibacter pohnpeiensis]MBK1883906.1 chemotaxis-specific protein-glutamate methyltransferase CheB [Luteolibacter pohnpeiensis]